MRHTSANGTEPAPDADVMMFEGAAPLDLRSIKEVVDLLNVLPVSFPAINFRIVVLYKLSYAVNQDISLKFVNDTIAGRRRTRQPTVVRLRGRLTGAAGGAILVRCRRAGGAGWRPRKGVWSS